MACHYFKKGYFGICTASALSHVPSITEMENFCFKEYYRICPIFADFMARRSQSGETDTRDFDCIGR
jgi:hypothetical protein